MKTILIILSICIPCFAGQYETYETNWIKTDSFQMKESVSKTLKKYEEFRAEIKTNRWCTNAFFSYDFITNSTVTNLMVGQRELTIYDNFVTNIIVSKNYTGTIQLGENFYHIATITNIFTEQKLTK